MNWWCLLIKIHNLFQCLWTAVTTTLSFLPLRENHMPDCRCSCWNVMLSNCCTNFSELTVPPPPRYFTVLLVCFFWGGSVCLSWLLEPSLSIKKGRSYFCSLFWISCEEYHEFVEWFTGTATPKRCLLLYISSGLLSLSAFICFCFPFGGSVLLYLTGLFYFFSDCFLEIKILWKNSGVCTSEHAVFDNKTWSPLKRLSNINQLLLKCSLLCKYSWSHFN